MNFILAEIKINNIVKCDMSTDEDAISEQSQIHPCNRINLSTDKNVSLQIILDEVLLYQYFTNQFYCYC